MIHSISFILFTMIECITIFLLAFAIFRIKFATYMDYIAITSFVQSVLVYVVRELLKQPIFAPVVTIVIVFLFLWLMFKFNFFHSLIMSVCGYIALAVLQTIIIFVSQSIHIFTLKQAQSNGVLGHIIQMVTFFISLVLVLLINNSKGLWVTFVKDNYHRVKYNSINLSIIISLVLAVIAITFVLNFNNILCGILLFVIITLYFSFLMVKKEMSDD